MRPFLTLAIFAASADALASSAWQKRLDRAVLDVDLTIEQRVRNLQRVWRSVEIIKLLDARRGGRGE